MSFIVLDPTEQPAPASSEQKTPVVERLTSLQGKRVGLLANGKTNADALLDAVGRLLERDYGAVVCLRENKREASRPAKTAILDRFDGKVDVVLTAVGD